MGLRYYSPDLARWTQRDPVGGSVDPSRRNSYPYVGGDPVNRVDPSGADFIEVLISSATYAGYGFAIGAIVGCAIGFAAGIFVPAAISGPILGCLVAAGVLGTDLAAIGALTGFTVGGYTEYFGS